MRTADPDPRDGLATADDDVHRVLVVATCELRGDRAVDAVAERLSGERESRVRVVAPALADSQFEHEAGAVDDGLARAEERLRRVVESLSGLDAEVEGRLGDADPQMAVGDALREFAADDLVIVTRPEDEAMSLEADLVAHARRRLRREVTHVVIDPSAEDGDDAVVTAGTLPPRGATEDERASETGRARRTRAAVAVSVVGTLIVLLVAALSISGRNPGNEALLAILAVFTFIFSTWHVIGALIFEASEYRGPWVHYVADLTFLVVPLAVVTSLVLALT